MGVSYFIGITFNKGYRLAKLCGDSKAVASSISKASRESLMRWGLLQLIRRLLEFD
jgi:hypothetical protein